MKSAIIIGFSYENNPNLETITSTGNDILSVKNAFNCESVHIITDITDLPMNQISVITDSKSFISALAAVILSQKSLIYYTGHGTKNGICLPSGEYISFLIYRNILLSLFPTRSEIIWIIDCCHSGEFPLPYKFEDSTFVMSNIEHVIEHDVICFVSSGQHERSISNENYSYFTKYLLTSVFGNRTVSLIEIDDFTRKKLSLRAKQTSLILSSFKCIPIVWTWLFGNSLRILAVEAGLKVYSEKF